MNTDILVYNNIALIIGHLVGDYALQNDWMAKNKVKPGIIGFVAANVHGWLYAAAVTIAVVCGGYRLPGTGPVVMSAVIACAVFATHAPVDALGLARRWMQFFGQTMEGPFFPCVYIGVDASIHFVLMWIALSVLPMVTA